MKFHELNWVDPTVGTSRRVFIVNSPPFSPDFNLFRSGWANLYKAGRKKGNKLCQPLVELLSMRKNKGSNIPMYAFAFIYVFLWPKVTSVLFHIYMTLGHIFFCVISFSVLCWVIKNHVSTVVWNPSLMGFHSSGWVFTFSFHFLFILTFSSSLCCFS